MTFIVCITVFIASMIQSIGGFGFALVLTPVLSLLIADSKEVTPIVIICGIIIQIIVFIKIKIKVDVRRIVFMIGFSLAGIPLGVYALTSINATMLKIVVGAITLITGVALYFNYSVKIKNSSLSYGGVGFVSGFLNGSTGLSGPPVILFLANQNTDKEHFLSTTILFGLFTNLYTIILFAFNGLITTTVIKNAAAYSPLVILGSFIGIRFAKKINQKTFRKIIIFMIILLGLVTIVSNVKKYV